MVGLAVVEFTVVVVVVVELVVVEIVLEIVMDSGRGEGKIYGSWVDPWNGVTIEMHSVESQCSSLSKH